MGNINYFTKEIKCKNIKPCPFCGRKAVLQRDVRYPGNATKQAYEVICINLDCVIYRADTYYSLTKKEAIEKWNNRANENTEGAVVLTRDEYVQHKGFSREEVEEISKTASDNTRKETAEKFAEMANTAVNNYKKSVGMGDYVVDAERMIFENNAIRKKLKEVQNG